MFKDVLPYELSFTALVKISCIVSAFGVSHYSKDLQTFETHALQSLKITLKSLPQKSLNTRKTSSILIKVLPFLDSQKALSFVKQAYVHFYHSFI